MLTFLTVLWFAVHASTPPLMIWGWWRWAKRREPRTIFSILSLIGFSLATASALLAIATFIYARSIGGFPFYDPRLLKIYRCGLLLSFTGIIFAIGGVWRAGPVRWHAPACASGMLLYWFMSASRE